jgi:hypothetical protein
MAVYFIQAERGGPIKIGYAVDELKRFHNIQTSHHETLVLRHAIIGDLETEREIHERFRKDRLRGEWFHPSPELVKFARAYGYLDPAPTTQEQIDLAEDFAEMLQGFGHDIQGLDIIDTMACCGFEFVDTLRREREDAA